MPVEKYGYGGAFNAEEDALFISAARNHTQALINIAKAAKNATYSTKSCRAGDGDERSWKECAHDMENLLEKALEELEE